jgi:hypothetical protein
METTNASTPLSTSQSSPAPKSSSSGPRAWASMAEESFESVDIAF